MRLALDEQRTLFTSTRSVSVSSTPAVASSLNPVELPVRDIIKIIDLKDKYTADGPSMSVKSLRFAELRNKLEDYAGAYDCLTHLLNVTKDLPTTVTTDLNYAFYILLTACCKGNASAIINRTKGDGHASFVSLSHDALPRTYAFEAICLELVHAFKLPSYGNPMKILQLWLEARRELEQVHGMVMPEEYYTSKCYSAIPLDTYALLITELGAMSNHGAGKLTCAYIIKRIEAYWGSSLPGSRSAQNTAHGALSVAGEDFKRQERETAFWKKKAEAIEETANAATTDTTTGQKGGGGNKALRTARFKQKQQEQAANRLKIRCEKCGNPGHLEKDCFTRPEKYAPGKLAGRGILIQDGYSAISLNDDDLYNNHPPHRHITISGTWYGMSRY